MELKDFIEKFADAIELDDATLLSGSTEFKELDEWSSLGALDIIAMVDDEYDVTITGKDIRSVSTIEELFNLIKDKA
jgi:acyl carrier protein